MTSLQAPAKQDPRPEVTEAEGEWLLHGSSCVVCGYAMAFQRDRCGRCWSPTVRATFGPAGAIWSSTVVRVAVAGRVPPYVLAYVDLVEGPRLLAHVDSEAAPSPGATVALSGLTDRGDPRVRIVR